MIAVLINAGENSRFYPLNDSVHKSFISLRGKPLIAHLIQDLIECDINKFVVVLNNSELGKEMQKTLESVKLDASITYIYQDNPQGQGSSVLVAEKEISEPFIFISSYHVGQKKIVHHAIEQFNSKKPDALVSGISHKDIRNYGALKVEGGLVKEIIEKPTENVDSMFRATSVNILSTSFIEYLKKYSDHYSFESALNEYCQTHKVLFNDLTDSATYLSLKYSWQLLDFNEFLGIGQKGFIHPSAQIAQTAWISPHAIIDEHATISHGAVIKGSSYIGKNAYVGDYSVIRDTDIEEHAVVGVYSDITRSILMNGVHSHGGGFIGDSVIGSHSKLARGFSTANKRTDRNEIYTYVKDEKINTQTERFGVVLGTHVHTGINTTTMPGVLIGSQSKIWPGVIVYKNIPQSTNVIHTQITTTAETGK